MGSNLEKDGTQSHLHVIMEEALSVFDKSDLKGMLGLWTFGKD